MKINKIIVYLQFIREQAKSIVFVSGVNQFCAVFYFLILTMDFSSQGCSVTQSSSMADQAPRRKLSTSLAVTCIESKFNRHAIQALHTLKQLTISQLLSSCPLIYILCKCSVSGNVEKVKYLTLHFMRQA